LKQYAGDQTVIAEGFGLLPERVAPLLTSPRQAIWLVPSAEFKWQIMQTRNKYTRRLTMSDPERAINNLLERDRLIAEQIQAQAMQHNLRVEIVDGTLSVSEMTAIVADHFEPFLGT
jgi:hypothetical protein